MKVLLVSLSNVGGGASRIVSTLHTELNKNGVDAELLIYEGKAGEKITILNNSKFSLLIFRLKNYFAKIIFLFFKNLSHDYRSINIFPSKMLRYINDSSADIIHLHWIGAEMISIKQLSKIKKKIIWTLHDAWPLNGSYHINPKDYFPNINPALAYKPDNSNILERITLTRKKKYLAYKNICFTSPSNWLKEKFDMSFYAKGNSRCYVIPNFIDFANWFPISKHTARKELDIKTTKTLLTFCSNNAIVAFNKGFHFIKELMNILPKEKFGYIIFGNENENIEFDENIEIFFVGKISDINMMRLVYSAGDITIVPSLSESFSLVSLESLACQTPVLAFNTSGVKDIVKHKQNGYLAEKFSIDSLKNGIDWINNNKMTNLPESVSRFSIQLVVQQYQNLYLRELNGEK